MSSTYTEGFITLLRALSLVEGSYKPSPSNPLPGNGTTNTIVYSNFDGSGFFGTLVDPTFNTSGPGPGYMTATFNPAMGVDIITDEQCPEVSYDSPQLINQFFAPFDPTAAAVYRYRKQQSVNLGSWFVQENWMVPSLFTCASGPQTAEIDVASGWRSTDNARAVLERHWDTFINQTDFDYLTSIGINTVRLPVGYWTLGPTFLPDTPFEPYASVYRNSWPRFVGAINMAAASNIGVLVDLHGVPGSQNGQPHSGISDGQARLFSNSTYMDKTIQVLTFLMEQLQNVTNVVGIEIANEPNDVPELPSFYTNAMDAMRQKSTGEIDLPLYIHDGFNLQQYSTFVSQRPDFVVEDHHSYFVFSTADQSEPASQHTSDIQGSISSDLEAAALNDRRNLVISEWSCALTDQSLASQSDPDEARKQFCTTQMDVYAGTSAGWAFWCASHRSSLVNSQRLSDQQIPAYYKEGCDTDQGWCFKTAVGKSLPETFYSYGKPPPSDPTQLQGAYAAVAGMTIPTQSDILGRLQSFQSASNDIDPWNMTDTQQQSSIEGYSDGYQTVKIFSQHGWSKLGFTEQYIQDSMSTMGGFLPEGTEDYYRNGFRAGLADGEAAVLAVLS